MKMRPREIRLIIYLVVLIVGLLCYKLYFTWFPDKTLESSHYIIYSTATEAQTRKVGEVADLLFEQYTSVLGKRLTFEIPKAKLKLKLYKNREEFRRYNPTIGWGEAFYLYPYCHQYFDANAINPYHWMLHEATHQLNKEIANLSLPKWIDEGLATYFSTSQITDNKLILGDIDLNTYPSWLLPYMRLTGNIDQDIAQKEIIPLRLIIADKEGPDINTYFNTYYLHWWSLMHFLFNSEQGKYQEKFLDYLNEKHTVERFEQRFKSIDELQQEWYIHLRNIITTIK